MRSKKAAVVFFVATLILAGAIAPAAAFAHCDGLDGPVVKAAQLALQTGDVNLVLVWVLGKYEKEIRDAFQKALRVRKSSAEAKSLADAYFFETLVRLHREGEGAPFTGLEPAGRDLGPAIPAADKALEARDVEPLVALLTAEMQAGLRRHFASASKKRDYDKNDVEAGREYVRAYVEFIHYAERLHEAAQKPSHGHEEESRPGAAAGEGE